MGNSINARQNFWNIDRRVSQSFSVSVNRSLIGPVFVQKEDFWVIIGMINFKSQAARFLARQPPLLRKQALNLGNVVGIFDRQDNIDVDHVISFESELLQKTNVILIEMSNILDSVTHHTEPGDPQSKRKAAHFIRVIPDSS